MTPLSAVASGCGNAGFCRSDDVCHTNTAGNCQDPACGQRVQILVNGYCINCATKHGVDTMRGCGNPICLHEEDASAAAPLPKSDK
ncbi:MAG: hypothetical protein K2W82_16075 [Candidatus Obscuribacterales bacterium]|nr:hypothetical protein [Candidatus Obscuribacterales bacterium]